MSWSVWHHITLTLCHHQRAVVHIHSAHQSVSLEQNCTISHNYSSTINITTQNAKISGKNRAVYCSPPQQPSLCRDSQSQNSQPHLTEDEVQMNQQFSVTCLYLISVFKLEMRFSNPSDH